MDNLLIILTADTCGHCNVFKTKHMKSLLAKTRNIKYLTTIHINLKTMNEQIDDKNHPAFRNASPKWFPSFYIFNEKQFYTFNKNLSGFVMNGKFENGNLTLDNRQKYNFSPEDIVTWINETINKIPHKIHNKREVKKYEKNMLFSNDFEKYNII